MSDSKQTTNSSGPNMPTAFRFMIPAVLVAAVAGFISLISNILGVKQPIQPVNNQPGGSQLPTLQPLVEATPQNNLQLTTQQQIALQPTPTLRFVTAPTAVVIEQVKKPVVEVVYIGQATGGDDEDSGGGKSSGGGSSSSGSSAPAPAAKSKSSK